MFLKHTIYLCRATILAIVLMVAITACRTMTQEAVPASAAQQTKPAGAGHCSTCHQPRSGSLRGNFKIVSYRSRSFLLRTDDTIEILGFDPKTLRTMNVMPDPDNPSEPLLTLKRGGVVRVEFSESKGGKFATLVAAGPAVNTAHAAALVYAQRPKPGVISFDDFKKIAINPPADTLILDVRDQDEANFGMIKGAKLIPDAEVPDRLAEIPKDGRIIAYCSTGVRAEIAYHRLKGKGYNVLFVDTNVEIDKDGNITN